MKLRKATTNNDTNQSDHMCKSKSLIDHTVKRYHALMYLNKHVISVLIVNTVQFLGLIVYHQTTFGKLKSQK